MTATPPFLTRVRIRNYKSIKACDVELGSLTFLVGPNGSGKSNFLDALRFVADALNTTLDHALRDRGGIGEVRRRSGGHPNNFTIRLDFQLPTGITGHYSIQIAARKGGGFSVGKEQCSVFGPGIAERESFSVAEVDGIRTVKTSLEVVVPAAAPDRLYLQPLSSIEPFRAVYDMLTRMCFYNLNPDAIRALQAPDPGSLLRRDGSNLASVLANLRKQSPETVALIEEYLGVVVPGVRSVERLALSGVETIEFRQDVAGQKSAWKFPARSMSDGTLRALAVLTALLQDSPGPPSLVAIEEPESALHPAAVDSLLGAIRSAQEQTQILVTSHSPELLHTSDIRADELLAVEAESGDTCIAGLNEGTRQVIAERLFTPGELLRTNQIEPSPEARDVAAKQLHFFER